MAHYILQVPVRLENMEPMKRRFQLVTKILDADGNELPHRYDGGYEVDTGSTGTAIGTYDVEITLNFEKDLARAASYRVDLSVWDETPTPAPFDPANPDLPLHFKTDTFRPAAADKDVDQSKPFNLSVEGKLEATLWHPPTPKPLATPQSDRLGPDERLAPDQSIVSGDGRFRFVMQSDGNLVLYKAGNNPLWSSNTHNHPEVREAVMQSDGNLVIYNSQSRPLWASATNGHPGASLVVQNDGNVVIYDTANRPLWSTNTFGL